MITYKTKMNKQRRQIIEHVISDAKKVLEIEHIDMFINFVGYDYIDARGLCSWNPDTKKCCISVRGGIRDLKQLIKTTLHELVHASQFDAGRLTLESNTNKFLFDGKADKTSCTEANDVADVMIKMRGYI